MPDKTPTFKDAASPYAPDHPPGPEAPRDAATLIILDRSDADVTRILMGQRRSKQIFMPNKYVFPGGRVDPEDASVPSAANLDPASVSALMHDMKGGASPERAYALAIAAIRETFEEAGLMIAAPQNDATVSPPSSLQENSSKIWQAFAQEGLLPCPAKLRFFARAITPPGRPRRYDTRFFVLDATDIAKRLPPPDDELRNLNWFTWDELQALDLANITRAILQDLSQWEDCRRAGQAPPRIPYYFFEAGAFRRVNLPR